MTPVLEDMIERVKRSPGANITELTQAGESYDSLRQRVKRLVQMGFIRREYRPDGSSGLYLASPAEGPVVDETPDEPTRPSTLALAERLVQVRGEMVKLRLEERAIVEELGER